MLKKPLTFVGRDEATERAIIDTVITRAVDAAVGIDVDETIDIPVDRFEYGYYLDSTNDGETNAYARNLADEAELHGLRFDHMSRLNGHSIICHFKVHGRLS